MLHSATKISFFIDYFSPIYFGGMLIDSCFDNSLPTYVGAHFLHIYAAEVNIYYPSRSSNKI